MPDHFYRKDVAESEDEDVILASIIVHEVRHRIQVEFLKENYYETFFLPVISETEGNQDFIFYVKEFMEVDAFRIQKMFLEYHGLNFESITTMDGSSFNYSLNSSLGLVRAERWRYAIGECNYEEYMEALNDALLLANTCSPHCASFVPLPTPTPMVTPTPKP